MPICANPAVPPVASPPFRPNGHVRRHRARHGVHRAECHRDRDRRGVREPKGASQHGEQGAQELQRGETVRVQQRGIQQDDQEPACTASSCLFVCLEVWMGFLLGGSLK